MPVQPSFFARLWLAIVCWFRIVFDARFAAEVGALRERSLAGFKEDGRALTGAAQAGKHIPKAAPLSASADGPDGVDGAGVLRLLSLLQREGRLIDFCEEELAGFSDAQVGAAARTVHDGCRKALREAVSLAPVRAEPEGTPITVPPGFDAHAVRLTGNVTGNPPFSGVLRHHGWKATGLRMPAASGDASLIAPAEVELS